MNKKEPTKAEDYFNNNQAFGSGLIPHFRVKELMKGFSEDKEERIEELEAAVKSAVSFLSIARLVLHTERKFARLPESLEPLDEEIKKEIRNLKTNLK